jgi:DNA repair exonuclease SbcCD ATPase subunit
MIAGKIDDVDVIVSLKTDTAELQKALDAGKTIEEFKKEIAVKKKRLKDELILIPSRIDEADRSIPNEENYEKIASEISRLESDVTGIDEQIMDASKAQKSRIDAVMELMKKRNNLNAKLVQIEYDEKSKVQVKKIEREQEIQGKQRELTTSEADRTRLLNEYKTCDQQIKTIEEKQIQLRERWNEVNDTKIEFNDDDFSCPTCKREFDISVINEKKIEMLANFNTDKSKKLSLITDTGKENGEELKSLKVKLDNTKAKGDEAKDLIIKLTAEISELEQQHKRLSANDDAELQKSITENQEYISIKKEISELSKTLDVPTDKAQDNDELIQRKKELTTVLDELKQKFSGKDQKEKQLARIAELKSQEESMNHELVNLEGVEFSIEQFTKSKMDMLESRINKMFALVKFKMFNYTIEGGQVETCITLINGVPYSDANTASKVQAGIDIINTLSEYYNVYAPVWIDNRESVTELPKTKSQIINLIVSPEHKKLTAGNQKTEVIPTKLFS